MPVNYFLFFFLFFFFSFLPFLFFLSLLALFFLFFLSDFAVVDFSEVAFEGLEPEEPAISCFVSLHLLQ